MSEISQVSQEYRSHLSLEYSCSFWKYLPVVWFSENSHNKITPVTLTVSAHARNPTAVLLSFTDCAEHFLRYGTGIFDLLWWDSSSNTCPGMKVNHWIFHRMVFGFTDLHGGIHHRMSQRQVCLLRKQSHRSWAVPVGAHTALYKGHIFKSKQIAKVSYFLCHGPGGCLVEAV